MQLLITSYLLQYKECNLPGLGIFKIVHTPASADAVNNKILPPFETVIFKEEDHSVSAGLIKYIAEKKHIEKSKAEDMLNTFCKEWKERINAGEKLNFETIGILQKDADGKMAFIRDTGIGFLQPVSVNQVYDKYNVDKSTDDMPTPDQEYVFVQKEEVIIERSNWGFSALILLAIGLVMLFYHFKDHKVTGPGIGNQHHFTVDSAGATYTVPR